MLNRASIIGHVGADPEIGTAPGGRRWCRFRIATSERWVDKQSGEKKEATEWHQIGVWGDDLIDKLVAPYIKKGSKIFVEGKLQTQKYTDDKQIERWTTRIIVQGLDGKITLLDRPAGRPSDAPMQEPEGRFAPPAGTTSAPSNGAHPPPSNGAAPPYPDEIPF